jgi:hypothetical protein
MVKEKEISTASTSGKGRQLGGIANSGGGLDTRRSGAVPIFDLMSIEKVPVDPEEKAYFASKVTDRLVAILERRLSRSELVLWNQWKTDADPEEKTKESESDVGRIWAKLDEILIDQAATIGWRIHLSTLALRRIQRWHDVHKNGPQLLKRFGDALVTSAKVGRGEAQHPTQSWELYGTRKLILAEMRALSNKLNAQLVTRAKLPDVSEIYVIIRNEICEFPLTYPALHPNLTSLLRYLDVRDSEEQGSLTKRLVTKQTTPAELVDGWLDHVFGTAEGKSRQKISRLGSQKRR